MAFELDIGTSLLDRNQKCDIRHDPKHLRDEPIIAHKVYDNCRRQDCLSLVARAAEPVHIDGKHIKEGEIIPVPQGAGSVTIGDITVKKVIIADKKPSPFKRGYWDVEIRFVFEYVLTFYKCDKDVILRVKANSIQSNKHTLFGSADTDFVMATDLFKGQSPAGGEPFIWTEAKAVALKTEFRCNHRDHVPVDVAVTIGLFSIITLFRLVCLNVQSRGFCVPRECDFNPTEPCEFFNGLEFPMDAFAPPQRAEFKRTKGVI